MGTPKKIVAMKHFHDSGPTLNIDFPRYMGSFAELNSSILVNFLSPGKT